MNANSNPISALEFQRIFEESPDPYLILDPDLVIVGVNDAYVRGTMTRRTTIVGRNVFEVFPDNPANPAAQSVRNLRASLERVIKTSAPDAMPLQRYDIRRPKSAGGGFEERYWSPLNTPVLGPYGTLEYIIHRVVDVTDFVKKQRGLEAPSEALREKAIRIAAELSARSSEAAATSAELKEANQLLAALNEKIRRLDQLKTRFFANVSHELRTPLTLILGPLRKVLATVAPGSEEHLQLEVVERNARQLYRHVTDLLDVAKLESGHMEMQYSHSDLVRLVRTTASNFESLADEMHIAFEVHTPPELDSDIDAEKYVRILLNLLSNAFKFTPVGGAVQVALTQEDGRTQLSVQDNGPGIPDELHETIFERFQQSGSNERIRHGGMGLGLSIVKEFAELHGGTVRVENAPGGGALFRVCLPTAAPKGATIHPNALVTDEIVAHQTVEELHGSYRTRRSPHGVKDAPLILIVEDNLDMSTYVAELLGQRYQIATAYDGQEGLERALALQPDLIVSDVIMPIMSGDEMVTALRTHPEIADTPIFMLSVRTDEEMRVKLLRQGVQDYISKPFSDEELLARVGRVMAERHRIGSHIRMLEEKAHVDPLTGLNNRGHFFELAEHELSRSKRYNEPMALAMLDVDHFKHFNDTYGHQVGDAVLRELGESCRENIREIDIPGRLGGEEFAIMLPGIGGAKALEAAERLRVALANRTVRVEPDEALSFTVSLGVTTRLGENDSISEMLRRADHALYAAKHSGRNCVRQEGVV